MSNVGADGTADLVAPDELVDGILVRWPWSEWSNALAVSLNESGWNPLAENDTRSPELPCGTQFRNGLGELVSAEDSVSYFQINLCNYPPEQHQELRTVAGNLDAAFALWQARSWEPWYYSAKKLELL